MSATTQPRTFLEATGGEDAPIALVGLPFDGTCSFRPGTRLGPAALRDGSWVLEEYSPDLDRVMEGSRLHDAGDIELPPDNVHPTDVQAVLDRIGETARTLLARHRRLLGLGGEHLVTYPLLEATLEHHPDLTLLYFDAHADLREEYLGQPLSHATTIRRCLDGLGGVGGDRIRQFGIRSGTQLEFAWMRKHGTLFRADAEGVEEALRNVAGPLYISVDIDIFDPSVVPGTGTPEPGGIDYVTFAGCLQAIQRSGLKVIGADVTELSPPFDPTGASAIVAAKVARELIILLQEGL